MPRFWKSATLSLRSTPYNFCSGEKKKVKALSKCTMRFSKCRITKYNKILYDMITQDQVFSKGIQAPNLGCQRRDSGIPKVSWHQRLQENSDWRQQEASQLQITPALIDPKQSSSTNLHVHLPFSQTKNNVMENTESACDTHHQRPRERRLRRGPALHTDTAWPRPRSV